VAETRKLLKTLPSEDEMLDSLNALRSAPDHALAITAAAHLDYVLELLIRNHIPVELTKEEDRRIFDGASDGILGTASAKIRVAYAFNILPGRAYEDMLLVNAIRNAFAHSLHNITFDNELVVSDCRKLSLLERRRDMYPDPLKINAREVYYNTILDLYMGIQINMRLPDKPI
jgi:DNA-binding MltR family transcriptional regulator